MNREDSSTKMSIVELPCFRLTPGNVADYSHLRKTISGYYVQDGIMRLDEG